MDRVSEPGANAEARPNVVLICTDQWRGDCLSIDGHPVVRTPYLDQLASHGAHFTRAYSATPSCVPARVALMTGLSQGTHRRVGYRDGVDFDIETTLPGEFARHGYHTQAIGKMHTHPARGRIGFDDILLHDGFLHFARKRERSPDWYDDYLPWLRQQAGQDAAADYFDHGINCNSVVARPWDKEERLHPTNWVVSQATQWLYRRDPTVPFFLYLSFHRPHPPYDPPEWAFEQYRDVPYDPPVGDWWEDFSPYRNDHDPTSPCAVYDEATKARARAGYYGHISHIDQQINRFIETLAEFGVGDNTYVMFVSDHGELMGDHNLYRKSLPYEGSARIPFILRGPSDSGIQPGITSDEIVELRDVMPTLLDCAGLPVPDSVEGRSVLPAARGAESARREYLHGEHLFVGSQSVQWITTDRFKYVWLSRDGVEHLFDLANDRTETRNLAGDPRYAGDLEHCRSLLVRELRGREEGFVREDKLIPGQSPVAVLTHS